MSNVCIVFRSDNAKTAMPPWTDVKADIDIVCNLSQRLNDVYPTQQIDVVVVGIFHQVLDFISIPLLLICLIRLLNC